MGYTNLTLFLVLPLFKDNMRGVLVGPLHKIFPDHCRILTGVTSHFRLVSQIATPLHCDRQYTNVLTNTVFCFREEDGRF